MESEAFVHTLLHNDILYYNRNTPSLSSVFEKKTLSFRKIPRILDEKQKKVYNKRANNGKEVPEWSF